MTYHKFYSYIEVDKFIAGMEKKGYIAEQIDEGVLGSGVWLLTSPDQRPNYVVIEVALNSWSSAHRIYSSNDLSTAEMWEIAQRFAREAEESRGSILPKLSANLK